MHWEGNAFVGSFFVDNTGMGPLRVTRVGLRSTPADPRLPQGVSAGFDEGMTTAVIGPNSFKRATVRWTPGRGVTQLYGHVVVESDTLDHKPIAVGFHADRELVSGAGWLFNHILSWLTFLPLLGMLLAFASHLMRQHEHRSRWLKPEALKWLGVGLMGLELLLAGWLFAAYNRDI